MARYGACGQPPAWGRPVEKARRFPLPAPRIARRAKAGIGVADCSRSPPTAPPGPSLLTMPLTRALCSVLFAVHAQLSGPFGSDSLSLSDCPKNRERRTAGMMVRASLCRAINMVTALSERRTRRCARRDGVASCSINPFQPLAQKMSENDFFEHIHTRWNGSHTSVLLFDRKDECRYAIFYRNSCAAGLLEVSGGDAKIDRLQLNLEALKRLV